MITEAILAGGEALPGYTEDPNWCRAEGIVYLKLTGNITLA